MDQEAEIGSEIGSEIGYLSEAAVARLPVKYYGRKLTYSEQANALSTVTSVQVTKIES